MSPNFYNPYMNKPDYGQGIGDLVQQMIQMFLMMKMFGNQQQQPPQQPMVPQMPMQPGLMGMGQTQTPMQRPMDLMQMLYRPPTPNPYGR